MAKKKKPPTGVEARSVAIQTEPSGFSVTGEPLEVQLCEAQRATVLKYAELPGQLALGREAFPVEQQAQPDRVGQPPGHSIGTAAGVERREQGACAYGRKRRWCHECPLPRTRVRAPLHVLDTNIWSCRLSESSIPGPRFAHGVVPA